MLRRKLLGTFAVTLLAGTIGMAPAATAAAPVPTAAASAPVATARPAPTARVPSRAGGWCCRTARTWS